MCFDKVRDKHSRVETSKKHDKLLWPEHAALIREQQTNEEPQKRTIIIVLRRENFNCIQQVQKQHL